MLKGTAATDLTTSAFFVRRVHSGRAGENWYLVWANRIGDTGTRLKVRIYGFDGNSVRTIWKRDELIAGRLVANDNTIALEYDKEYHSLRIVHEVFHIGKNGIRLISAKDTLDGAVPPVRAHKATED